MASVQLPFEVDVSLPLHYRLISHSQLRHSAEAREDCGGLIGGEETTRERVLIPDERSFILVFITQRPKETTEEAGRTSSSQLGRRKKGKERWKNEEGRREKE